MDEAGSECFGFEGFYDSFEGVPRGDAVGVG